MAEVTAALVKELRQKSGSGMMDCKKALTENDGNMEAAVDWLRKKGLASAAKKSGRAASEGLVAVAVDGTKGAVVELNSETDFVARNEQFQSFAADLAGMALSVDDIDALKTTDMDGAVVADKLTDLIATIGENMDLRRMAKLSVTDGVVASYMHGAVSEGRGKIGVLVALESTGDKDTLVTLGKQIAMHIAATNPESLDIDGVDSSALEREKSVIADQARAAGKPDDIIEKMLAGRIRKYYEQVVLLEQKYVIDGETKISKVLENAAGDLGTDVKLTGYVRFELGEGVEKKEDNFAAEVAAMSA